LQEYFSLKMPIYALQAEKNQDFNVKSTQSQEMQIVQISKS
jgi:hypothetical protein